MSLPLTHVKPYTNFATISSSLPRYPSQQLQPTATGAIPLLVKDSCTVPFSLLSTLKSLISSFISIVEPTQVLTIRPHRFRLVLIMTVTWRQYRLRTARTATVALGFTVFFSTVITTSIYPRRTDNGIVACVSS